MYFDLRPHPSSPIHCVWSWPDSQSCRGAAGKIVPNVVYSVSGRCGGVHFVQVAVEGEGKTASHTWRNLVPNSQIIVIPYPPNQPHKYEYQPSPGSTFPLPLLVQVEAGTVPHTWGAGVWHSWSVGCSLSGYSGCSPTATYTREGSVCVVLNGMVV